jgi:hypothetical protein
MNKIAVQTREGMGTMGETDGEIALAREDRAKDSTIASMLRISSVPICLLTHIAVPERVRVFLRSKYPLLIMLHLYSDPSIRYHLNPLLSHHLLHQPPIWKSFQRQLIQEGQTLVRQMDSLQILADLLHLTLEYNKIRDGAREIMIVQMEMETSVEYLLMLMLDGEVLQLWRCTSKYGRSTLTGLV